VTPSVSIKSDTCGADRRRDPTPKHSSVTSDVIIRDGQIDCDRLRKAHMSGGDLKEDLRSAGVADVRDVLEARLERSGELSVIKKKTP
jgi:uncharacterized membrane protein YcaP (DUF421 family)